MPLPFLWVQLRRPSGVPHHWHRCAWCWHVVGLHDSGLQVAYICSGDGQHNPESSSPHSSSGTKMVTAVSLPCQDTAFAPFPGEATASGNGSRQLWARVCAGMEQRRHLLAHLVLDGMQDVAAEAAAILPPLEDSFSSAHSLPLLTPNLLTIGQHC